MDFPKQLKQCQRQRHMTNDAFAKYLGRSRTWLQCIYSTHSRVEKSLLSDRTIYEINELLDIPTDVMDDYNKVLMENRLKQKGTDTTWAD